MKDVSPPGSTNPSLTRRPVLFMAVASLLIAVSVLSLLAFVKPQVTRASGRDPLVQPFASTSIWNMPIGSSAQYVAANIPKASNVTPDPNWFVTTSSSDPQRNVYAPGNWGPGRCTGTSYVTSTPFPDNYIVPDATNGNTPNNAAAILQPDGHTLVQLEPLARCTAGGNVYGYQACTSDLYGDGICGAHFGSGLSSIGGEIRLSELQASGDNTIPHALQLEIWDNYLGACNGTINGYRWPADRADGGACDPNNPNRYKGSNLALVQGSLLAIPPSATPQSLGITTAVGRKMFYALQNYGGYIVDDTGWDDNQVGVENTVPNYYDFYTTYASDINILFNSVQVINNNSPTSIGGGGTPRVPLAPPLNGTGTTPTPTPTPCSGCTGALSGSVAAAGSSYNLTSVGTSDWAHWGRGGTYGNFDHKSSGGSQISNVTTTGTGGNYGGWTDASRSVSWSDGTPTASGSNDQGYIWSNGSLNTGFVFTVPADTTSRTLTVYLGGNGVGSTLTAHLSDGSATDYTDTKSGSGVYSNVYTITYHAATAGSTLQITYLKTSNVTGTTGSADLDAAWLTTGTSSTPTPTPTPTSTPTPTPTPNPTGGALSGSAATAGSSYNLTNVGTSDWAHWGRGGTYGNFDHKSSGGSQISNVTTTGTGGNYGGWTDASRSVSWSDGTPTASGSNDQGYIWSNGSLNTGFVFTVPADTTSRTLTVYLGGNGVGSTLTAHLSDSSAADYTDTKSGSGIYSNVYTITYHAASAGQTLKITYLKTSNVTGTTGSADLDAAWLTTSGSSTTGALSGSVAAAGSSYNLTNVGTKDWAHWGRGGTYGNFDHKSSGGSQISNVTTTGSGGNYGGWTDASRSVSWSDGTPTASGSNDQGYIWSNGSLNTGFVFTVPADTTTRTLTIYLGGNGVGSTLTAHLSDGSAVDYTNTQSGSGIYSNVYTITYHAASAGQTLKITYLKTSNITGTNGSADLDAAWLS